MPFFNPLFTKPILAFPVCYSIFQLQIYFSFRFMWLVNHAYGGVLQNNSSRPKFWKLLVYGTFLKQLSPDLSFTPKVHISQWIKNRQFINKYHLEMLLSHCQKRVQMNAFFNVKWSWFFIVENLQWLQFRISNFCKKNLTKFASIH